MKRFNFVMVFICLAFVFGGCLSSEVKEAAVGFTAGDFRIVSANSQIFIDAGNMRRVVSVDHSEVSTTSLKINGEQILARPANELSFQIERAVPNRKPVGLKAETAGSVTQKTSVADSTDALDVKQEGGSGKSEEVEWGEGRRFKASSWGKVFDFAISRMSVPKPGVKQVITRVRCLKDATLKGVSVNIYHEVYDGYPVIRKWVEVTNNSPNWLKLSNLVIDDIELKKEFRNQDHFTPSERGAGSSIVGFSNTDKAKGLILASEVPSALRMIGDDGAMGYNPEYFEWILGPAESFTSEPVFMYGFSGEVVKTISGSSLPLDRAIEGPFKEFLKEHVGLATTSTKLPGPVWCTWTNFAQRVNDEIIREQAVIAGKAGFGLLQIDDGWQKGRLGVTPDTNKFPDLLSTCEFVRSQGIGVGLWVSCFRLRDSDDLKALPDAAVVPEVRRHEGVAMSFSSDWPKYYGDQLAFLHDYYGATYFKQDFTNIKYGDFGESHFSRSKKESLLRGIRGLFESQDVLRAKVPGIANQITHEIYWGTPGVPCDIAVVKHAATYHIPPNDYSGVGHWKQRHNSSDWWDKVDPEKMKRKLLKGCSNARNRFYLHRGLPLECVEYYGASTVNCKGSLTGEIQDRQICSWLMGAPSVYAGDLASLTEENIKRYRNRFEIIGRLQKQYDIYRYFQYSGVPAPTDSDWHWWGKLNGNSEGAVVVIRGSGGEDKRKINIPWVQADKRYELKALLAGKVLGTFKGSDLINGKLEIALPVYGQEILEVSGK